MVDSQEKAAARRKVSGWKQYGLYGAGVLVALTVLSWACLLWVVPSVVQKEAAKWAQGLGRRLSIGEVAINPREMSIELSHIQLTDKDGSPLFAANRVYFNADPSALLVGRWQAAELTLDQPRIWLDRHSDGLWNWAAFVAQASGPAKPDSGHHAMPKFVLEALNIHQGQVRMHDQLGGDKLFDVTPVNLELTDITSLPEHGEYNLRASLHDGTRLDWRGDFRLQPLQSRGVAQVSGLTLASIWGYVQPYFNTALPQGAVSLKASYQFDLSGTVPHLQVNPFSAQLKGLVLKAPQTGSAFSIESVTLERGKLDLDRSLVEMGKVQLKQGVAEATLQPDGRVDWLAALPVSKPEPVKPATPVAKATPWSVKVGQLALDDWQYRVTDKQFVQPLTVEGKLPRLSGTISMLPQQGLQVDKLALSLADIGVRAGNQPAALSLKQLELGPSSLALQQRQVHPGKVVLTGLQVEALRDKQGRINLVELFKTHPVVHKETAVPKAATEPAAGPAWQLSYPEVALQDAKLAWVDKQWPKPVSLTVDNLTSKVSPAQDGTMDVTLGARIGKGQLDGHAMVDPKALAAKGQLNLKALPLQPLAPYALAGTPLRLAGGDVSSVLSVQSAKGRWSVKGNVGVAHLAVMEPGQAKPLLGWQQLLVSGIAMDSQPSRLTINDIKLVKPAARIILDQQRNLNVQKLMAGATVLQPTAGKTAPAKTKSSATMPVEVKTVHVQKATVAFADLSMSPNFMTTMHDLSGSVQGLSTRPGRKGTVTLDGNVDQYGDVKVRGVLAPMAPTDNTDLTLAFRNISLNSLNPYSMTFAGWQINDGRLSVDLRYLLDHRQMKGENRVVINSIQLGNEQPDYKGTHLPLRLAVAILEDSDGNIDLDLPVSGSLDDPKFSYGAIIWKAFVNVISKVATAPFRALGALIGSDSFDEVRFVAGEAAVAPPEREKLEKVAAALVKRPKLKLEIDGTVDADVDSKELARARIDQAILRMAGRSLAAGEPLPLPDMEDPAIQTAIRQLYIQKLGRLKWLGHSLKPGGPSGTALAQLLRTEMLAAEKVDASALTDLAQSRARGAQQVMMQIDNTLAGRITVGSPTKARAGRDGVALEMKLSSQ